MARRMHDRGWHPRRPAEATQEAAPRRPDGRGVAQPLPKISVSSTEGQGHYILQASWGGPRVFGTSEASGEHILDLFRSSE